MINAIWEGTQVLCINSASSSKEIKKDKENLKKKLSRKEIKKKNQNREGLQRVWLLAAACDGNQKSVLLDVISRWVLKIIQGTPAQELEEKEKLAGQTNHACFKTMLR